MSRFIPQVRSRPLHALTALAVSALATAALLTSPTVASAGQWSGEGLSATVYFDSSDLSTERGTLKVYRRIEAAARSVCPGDDSQELEVLDASKACQRYAIAQAIGKIGSARLAALGARAKLMSAG